MSALLAKQILALPEIYQAIYGHPDLSENTSRACSDRLEKIVETHDALRSEIGRPLRVLDLGCAQGFFSLNLAARGAIVHGIDFLDKNIDVCNTLAAENPQLSITFEVARVEAAVAALEPGQYDLILGLSVFHHIVHEHGLAQVQSWLKHAIRTTSAIVLELALHEEPLYWAAAQPQDPRELLADCAFVHELGRYDTHLSPLARPLLVASDSYWILGKHAEAFETWTIESHGLAQNTHKGTRRYYIGRRFFVKTYRYQGERSQYNRDELANEIAFLSAPPPGVRTPDLLVAGSNDVEGWVAMDRIHGKLLLDLLAANTSVDVKEILHAVLVQLASLEAAGLCHTDLRTWNIFVLDDDTVQLIDFGSVSTEIRDCVWPENPYLAFIIFVYEVATRKVSNPYPLRTVFISPYNLPNPFKTWVATLWQLPMEEWSFKRMLDLFDNLPKLAHFERPSDAGQAWMGAMEAALQTQNDCTEKMLTEMNTATRQLELRLQQAEHNAEQAKSAAEHAETEGRRSAGKVEQITLQMLESNRHLQKIYASRSWAITAPLRWAGNAAKSVICFDYSAKIKNEIKQKIRSMARWVLGRPSIKAVAQRLLSRMPRVNKWLQRILSSDLDCSTGSLKSIDIYRGELPPRAEAVYATLVKSLDDKSEGSA